MKTYLLKKSFCGNWLKSKGGKVSIHKAKDVTSYDHL